MVDGVAEAGLTYQLLHVGLVVVADEAFSCLVGGG
jgi:hypothetical protein